MSKWTNFLLQYCDENKTGKCPVCGKTNVEVQEHINGNRKSLTFSCKDCKASAHFDGFLETKSAEKQR